MIGLLKIKIIMFKKEPNWLEALRIVLISIFVWVGFTGVIQVIKCPELTNTQLSFRILHSFILDFIECQ